ncbi:MAG TPA: hypothetical protein DEA44_03695 [Firmicutes bacterium]|nr:hypothetical protein [Bacillota bacterium]HWR56978.1 hypothetical protein [Negativicutes bacterium]
MKKRMTAWVVGGLLAVSALGVAFNSGVGNAGGKITGPATPVKNMMQEGQRGEMDPQMMNSPESQKQCLDMMKNPEMQQGMKEMIKQPEMQAMMKQMLAGDPEMRRMMSDLLSAAESSSQAGDQTQPDGSSLSDPGTVDHNAHHSS